MSDEVIQRLDELSVADVAEKAASNTAPAEVPAVAGLDLALASLRELIGQYAEAAVLYSVKTRCIAFCLSCLSE